MIKFLFRPLSLLFIGIYIGFIFWLFNGKNNGGLSDFPWGNTYLEYTNGKLYGLHEASYHFNTEEDSYISFENYDHFKEGVYYEYPDGTIPNKISFSELKFNKFFRTLSAVCDFQSLGKNYMRAYFDYFIYENNHGFSKESGYELDVETYEELMPFFFPNGATLIVEACSNNQVADSITEVFFRFEKEQYPNNEPSYETETIRITDEMSTYKISIPKSHTKSGYSSVLMYLENINTSLIIKNIILEFHKGGKEFASELIFSKSFGSADIYEPFSYKDFKWEYKFKFSKDFSKIKEGYLEIHSDGHEPWRRKFGPDWFYINRDRM